MKRHYLLLKEHKVTGLKYLCYHYGTEDNCFKYSGSGLYWTRHLSKHGRKISTVILDSSDTREGLVNRGLHYSEEWDVVNSKEFANLTVECCQTTAEPLSRPDVRLKRDKSFRHRLDTVGQTDKEKARSKKATSAMQDPEVRARAAKTFNDRRARGELTEKELQAGENRKKRIAIEGFTEAELANHNKTSEYQKGKTMLERCGEGYIDPRKGTTRSTPNSTKGKTAKEIHGEDWIDPRSKSFTINGELFETERDCFNKTGLSDPILRKLKREGTYTVKRLKNSKHKYENKQQLILELI